MRIILLILLWFGCMNMHAQDSIAPLSKPVMPKKTIPKPVVDTTKKNKPQKIDSAQKNKPLIVAPKADSATIKDSLQKNAYVDSLYRDSLYKDSVAKIVAKPATQSPAIDTSTYNSLLYGQYFLAPDKCTFEVILVRNPESKDPIFYMLLFLIFILAAIRAIFPKYFSSLFTLFLQSSFRQKQTREQMLQFNMASLLMNILFILSAGVFAALFIKYKNLHYANIWWLILYCSIGFLVIYLVKYVFLIFSGWVFNAKEAADTYLFIVFLVNKIFGVFLIPFILVLAFSQAQVVQIALVAFVFVAVGLLVYRYIASLGIIRNIARVNAIHFFLYLCAVEVLPLLLIYKALLNTLVLRY